MVLLCAWAILLVACQWPAGSAAAEVDASNAAGRAPDWPHPRGPAYDGVSAETGIAESWPAAGPPVLWTCELGQGYSGFAVVGDRVFTQPQSLLGQYVLCLDAHTGGEVWRHRYGGPWQPASVYPGPYATPTWRAGRVYFAAPDGQVGCLEAASGRPVWSANVLERFRGRGCEFGYACTPLVEDGKVILPVGGPGASMVALEAGTGVTVWAAGDDPASYCPALPITFAGQRQVIGFLRNSLAAFDLATGRPLWKQPYSVDYDEHAAWPLYREPLLFTAAPFRGGCEVIRLETHEGGYSVRRRWASRELSNDIFSSILLGKQVYGFDLWDFQARAHRPSRGRFKCLDVDTGKVHWSTDRTGHANVIAVDGKLILLSDTGMLMLARGEPTGYHELARAAVLEGNQCWTAPALSRGRLFVRNASRAVCLFVGLPERMTQRERQRAVSAADLPHRRSIDWDFLIGREPEYPFDPPTPAELARRYAVCAIGVFGPVGLLGILASVVAGGIGRGQAARAGQVVFWSAAFLLGLAGTAIYSRLWDTFILTWPASLFVAHQVTLVTVVWVQRQPSGRRPRWRARVVVACFLVICLGYYELCKVAGAVPAWRFLIGFLPAWPLALPAAYTQVRRSRPPLRALLLAAAFSLYFWASGFATAWRLRP